MFKVLDWGRLLTIYQQFNSQHQFEEGTFQRADHGTVAVFDGRHYPSAQEFAEPD